MAGGSGGVTMMWRDKIDASTAGSRSQRGAWTNVAHDRLSFLLDEELTPKERRLFVDVFINDYFKRWSGERLAEMGWLLSGYTGKEQSISAGISRIQALLERIARFYNQQ